MSSYLQQGQLAINAKNMDEAIRWFELAVQQTPSDAQALACLGQALCWKKQTQTGLDYLRQAGAQLVKTARKSRDTQHVLMLAEQLQFWNDYPGSLQLIKQAVQIQKNLRGFQLLAHTYGRLNENKLALAASRQALNMGPRQAVLHLQHASLEVRLGYYDAAIERLKDVLTFADTSEVQFRAHKELARIFDKLGQYAEVFPHLHKAAALSATLPEVKKQDKAFVPELLRSYRAGFDSSVFENLAVDLDVDSRPAPVFLIGFLRSGTTLTQEVLATHPDVFVSDETDLIVSVKNELERISPLQGNIVELLRRADLETIRYLRNFYWQLADQRYGEKINKAVFVDKTTMNTFDVGLINVIFPDAKLLFVRRDPRDVCLSCFMQIMTPTNTTVHLFEWSTVAKLYAQTLDWWLYIRPLLTVEVLEFRYEEGVTNFEDTFRRVFGFVGLDWCDNAIEFHKTAGKKFIASPSFDQVTQPLYASSVSRWKHYESDFADIEHVLAPYINVLGYA